MSKLIASSPLSPMEASSRPLPASVSSDRHSEAEELPLTFFVFILRRHFWRIATFVLIATTVVTLFTLALPKKYEASVLLQVDPEGQTIVGAAGNRSSVATDASVLVETEAKVIKSPAVVLQAIQNLGLDRNPEFAGKPDSPQLSAAEKMDRILRVVTSDITVSQPTGTLLLQITFRSHNPQLSSDVANGLARAFLEHEYATRSKALTDSSKYMTDQLDGLRAQMERDQTALVDYESTHDVIDADDKNNIYQARLSQINNDLSDAQSQRMKLQADYEVVQSGNLDALLASPRGQSLVPLQRRLIDDQRVLGRMSTIYGPKHPLYRQQAALVQHDKKVLDEQEQHIADQVQQQYHAAAIRERLIASALTQEKKSMDGFNMRAIRYSALKAAADTSSKLYYDLQAQIQSSTVSAGLRSEDLRIISPARPSQTPVFPRPILTGFLVFILASGLGVGGTILASVLDNTITSPEQVELRFQTRTISAIPLVSNAEVAEAVATFRDGAALVHANGATALKKRSSLLEAILSLHSAIQFTTGDRLQVLAITSSIPGEGKSTIVCHLAAAYASLGHQIVLVDADMRKPNVHRIFGISNRFGLSSLLRNQKTLEDVLVSPQPNLAILPSGPVTATPAELLHMGLSEVIEQLKTRFDVVLIDCPPALGFADSSAVANMAEGVLLVVGAGTTEQQLVAGSLRQLRGVRANVLGVILNRVSDKLDTAYSYYKDYYRSYYSEGDDSVSEDD